MSIEKRVDEDWKQQVEREKRSPTPKPGGGKSEGARSTRGAPPGPISSPQAVAGEFTFLLSSLSMQALIALGELPHPATQSPQIDLEQAKMLIDILGALKEKTQGNLTSEEAQTLEGLLYELRMKFVAKTQEGAAA